jgi:hypothetical protein
MVHLDYAPGSYLVDSSKAQRGDCAYESPRTPCPLREGSNAPKAVGRNHHGIRHDKPVRRGEGPKNEKQRLVELLSRKQEQLHEMLIRLRLGFGFRSIPKKPNHTSSWRIIEDEELRCLGVLAFWLYLLPATICSANPPRTILLWPGGAPGALGTRDVAGAG